MEPERLVLDRLGRSEIISVNRCDRPDEVNGLANGVPQGYLHDPALEAALSHAKRNHRRGYIRSEGIGIGRERQLTRGEGVGCVVLVFVAIDEWVYMPF